MSVKNLVSEFVKEAPPYVVGADEQSKSMRPGVTKLLQLATNENPFGTSPKAAEAICQQAPLANRYPDVRAQDLRKKLAEKHGLSVDEVMVTEGATAGLGFIAEVFIQPGDEIILTPPTYPSYYNYVKRCRGKLVEVPLEEDTLTPDFNKVLAAITDKTKAIFLCNPNNPTATLIDAEELHAFQKKLPEHVLLVVDEAYIDFVEDPDYRTMVDAISDDANLIVVRTFSKLYGMAGARMGYLMSNNEIIEYLQRDSTGFCCSRMGLHAAEAALDDVEFQETTKKGNKEGREILVSCMKELGFRVWPSHTNFIYFDPGVDVKWFADRLLDYGIIIRGNFNANRISIGTPEERFPGAPGRPGGSGPGKRCFFKNKFARIARAKTQEETVMQSLGFVETQGYVPAFAVADAMVKAANVEIVKKVWIGAAMVTIIVRGEVGAVRTAVDAGAAAANKMDALLSCYTIARPTEELVNMLQC